MLKRLIKNGFSPESVRRIKNLRARAFRRNTVKGLRGNIIERCDTYMENCRIEFHGIGNTVILGGGNSLIECGIYIRIRQYDRNWQRKSTEGCDVVD